VSTTTETPTVEQLREQLAEQEHEVEAARLALGAAALDSPNPRAASKRLTEAEAAVQRTVAAIAEVERREAKVAEQARREAASAARLHAYEWMAEFMRRAEALLLRRAEFEAAEAHLKELGPDRKVLNAQMPGRHTSMDESDLETALLGALPMFPRGRDEKLPKGFTVERARKLRGFAEARAEEEASGNGADRSAPFGTHAGEQTRELKAARQARQAEELAAAERQKLA